MKKKILIITSILFVVFLIIAIVFFFLMKDANPSKQKIDAEEYDVGPIIEKIQFLKFNTFDEVKKYADESPIYIQNSDDKNLFGIGELYIEDFPIRLFYSLNDDGTINRFDGTYSLYFDELSTGDIDKTMQYFSGVVADFFDTQFYSFSAYDESGARIDAYSVQINELLLNGKAKYGLSVIDESNTYWYISIFVTEEKQIDFEFFRCFDLSVYNDNSLDIDLRPQQDTEVE